MNSEDKENIAFWIKVAGALVIGLAGIWSFQYNATHKVRTESAGHFESAELSGDSGDVGVGISMTGRPGVFATGDTRATMVRTDKQIVAVDGVFTAKLGEPLELVTMANGSKRLCASDSADSCRPLAN
ncbi:hypothetical protein PQQ59_33360 [Paraburkholderia aspalathi]|uniref:Uncharacterized protein n=1 Tax=Paraburkholderia phytofirmans OLGA172 TaxID=1417228 RepID=A0A161I0Q2_9BURK|nr:hypothetical protein [Paraburkholderia phytofirmans]ANB78071.1 hypothetical protein AYM40_37585 [Paraburkholderia phytofirmans OLGA172]